MNGISSARKNKRFQRGPSRQGPRQGSKGGPGSPFLYVETRGFGHTGPQRVSREATKHQRKLANTKRLTEKRFVNTFGIKFEENSVKHVVWHDLR